MKGTHPSVEFWRQPRSWRELPVHPAAELFPMMSEAELRELGEDILKNGLQSPVVLHQQIPKPHRPPVPSDFKLLEGRNRLAAPEQVGIPVKLSWNARQHCWVVHAEGARVDIETRSTSDPYAFVLSANMHRRHLTAEDKRKVIADLIKLAPEKSDRAIAETIKASPTTVGKVRAKLESSGDLSNLDTRTDKKGRKQPAKKRKNKTSARNAATTPDDKTRAITREELAASLKEDERMLAEQEPVGSPPLEGELSPPFDGELIDALRLVLSYSRHLHSVQITGISGQELGEIGKFIERLHQELRGRDAVKLAADRAEARTRH
jgi:hypothetical protein